MLVANAMAIKMNRVKMTNTTTTQRKIGIRVISCNKAANPRLNRVRASYTDPEKPTAACLIQIAPKTKKQLSNRTKRIVVVDSANNLRRSPLRYLSNCSFSGYDFFRSGFCDRRQAVRSG